MTILDDQLAALNRSAAMTLERLHPEPPGLPPPGSWIRVMRLDDDARAKPVTPWHYVIGWDAPIGCLSTRCRRRAGRDLNVALDRFRGVMPQLAGQQDWRYRQWERAALLVEPDRPADGACGTCVVGLERDAAAEVRARKAAELERLAVRLPELEAIASDGSIDDAERGRRLRELWAALAR
jgi:hypothetical protein